MMLDNLSFYNKRRLLTPGPTQLPEEVRLVLAIDMMHHRKDEFRQIMAETQLKLRKLFGTSTPVLPLSCSGTGAMTAAVGSLFKPGEIVLVIEAGKFGERWSEIAKSRNLNVVTFKNAWGEALDMEHLASKMRENPAISAILVQLCETSTGAMLPVREIARLAHENGALCVVDGISAVGISPCPMDDWELDCLLTGSQKGLLLPPGLALISLSEKAWEKAEKVTPACYYFNLLAEKKNILKNQTHFTTPVNLILGLAKSLDLLLKHGLSAVYLKQWALTSLVRSGCQAMGLELLAKTAFSWGVTAIKMPLAIDASLILNNIQKEFGIVMAGGQDSLKGKIIRIGHMGWVDWADCMAGLLALGESLKALTKFTLNPDFEKFAMGAYLKALEDGFPQI